MTTMPKLGIAANKPASASAVPRSASSAGIRNATPLMKMKALAVTASEIATIDHRAPVPIDSAAIRYIVPHACGGDAGKTYVPRGRARTGTIGSARIGNSAHTANASG
ncbi:hypothetical protein MFM001_28320 [Mycobacterium sp. MFM001]|nr:hypothetical protein MFM001_28320 [Mycobacterium sp. MFM001]